MLCVGGTERPFKFGIGLPYELHRECRGTIKGKVESVSLRLSKIAVVSTRKPCR